MSVCPTNFVLQVVMSAEEAHNVQSATISVSEERQASSARGDQDQPAQAQAH